MAQGLIDNAKLSAIADAIRAKNGETEQYTPDTMAEKITAIPTGGGALPTLDNPAAVGDVAAGKDYIDSSGAKKTGTMPDATDSDVVVGLSPATGVVGAVVTGNGTVKRLASALSKSLQLPVQAGVTITPTDEEQVAVAAGRYVTGNVKVAAIPPQMFSDEDFVATGSFTPAADLPPGFRIDYTQDSAPYLIVLWTTNPALTDGETNLSYRIGGFYLYVPGVTQHRSDGGVVASSGQPVLTSGVNLAYQRIYPQSGQIIIGSSDAYPLKAGIEYKWMARWLA